MLKGETRSAKWELYNRKSFLGKALMLLNTVYLKGGGNLNQDLTKCWSTCPGRSVLCPRHSTGAT